MPRAMEAQSLSHRPSGEPCLFASYTLKIFKTGSLFILKHILKIKPTQANRLWSFQSLGADEGQLLSGAKQLPREGQPGLLWCGYQVDRKSLRVAMLQNLITEAAPLSGSPRAHHTLRHLQSWGLLFPATPILTGTQTWVLLQPPFSEKRCRHLDSEKVA